MGKLFGTDGIRGIANEKITPLVAYGIGKPLAIEISKSAKYHKVLVGIDTRVSGPMLRSAFVAGLNEMGFSAIMPGVLPTPALSYLTSALDVDAGVMITASHNPANHNGIKLFDSNGLKLSEKEQGEIEKIYFELDSYRGVEASNIGSQEVNDDLLRLWVDHILNSLKMPKLNGIKVAIDTANGAGSAVIPYTLKFLGAQVISFNNSLDGREINADCGSVYIENFAPLVKSCGADIGFSYDGDADRVLVVSRDGTIYDGTDIMYIFAKYLKEKGELKDNTVVSTIITNCGLETSLNELGIQLLRTNVGGQYIEREMVEKGYNLGGEENGHIMFSDVWFESCGLTTSLMLLKILIEKQTSLAELLKGLNRTIIANADVAVSERQKIEVEKGVLDDFVSEIENELGTNGRIVVRPSGTESVVRVLVEGREKEKLDKLCAKIVEKINRI